MKMISKILTTFSFFTIAIACKKQTASSEVQNKKDASAIVVTSTNNPFLSKGTWVAANACTNLAYLYPSEPEIYRTKHENKSAIIVKDQDDMWYWLQKDALLRSKYSGKQAMFFGQFYPTDPHFENGFQALADSAKIWFSKPVLMTEAQIVAMLKRLIGVRQLLYLLNIEQKNWCNSCLTPITELRYIEAYAF